jgi:hypothetical protein
MVWKKTGGLDLMLPVLWKIREGYPQAKITLLIAEINKHHLIRDGVFYMRFCEHHNIELLDFIDFLPNWLRPFRNLLRQLTKRAPVDGQSNNRVVDFILYHLTKFLKNQVDYTLALSTISADMLFINDEWWDELPKPLMDLIIKHHRKIFLAQHGPTILAHEKPSDMQERVMLRANPTLVDGIQSGKVFHQHWFETPNGVGIYRHVIAREPLLGPYQSKQVPLAYMGLEDREESIELERLTYVGFPGFDSEWFSYLKGLISVYPSFSILPTKRKKLRYMLLTRDVMELGDTRRKSTSEDLTSILKTLQQEIHGQYEVEILVKPHPKQNINNLKRFLHDIGFENPLVVADALYVVLPSVDFAITMQSSGSYYPLIYGLPCIHLMKGEYGQRDYLFNEMEYNLNRVVTDLDEFPNACRALMQELHTYQPIANDVEHMRKFYPDGATNLIIDQIKGYLE